VTTVLALAEQVEAELHRQLAPLPRRALAGQALAHGHLLVAADLMEAAAIANAYAPEHLCLAIDDAAALVPFIRNAGAVFAGHAAAETFGDYVAGSSHVLPTDGAARAWSGITTQSFMKAISVQHVSKDAGRTLAPPAAALARLEALEAHARAADARAA
jgi:histidinol dehydrogenase